LEVFQRNLDSGIDAAWIDPDQFFSSRDTSAFVRLERDRQLCYKRNVLQWEFLSGASRQLSVNIGGGDNSLQGAVTNLVQLSSNTWTHMWAKVLAQ
jgi:hypothetical protein